MVTAVTDPDMSGPENTGRNQDGTWVKGVSGNPAGKPKGARHKLQEDFFKALADDFKTHGVKAIIDMRDKSPNEYAKMVAGLMTKEIGGPDGEAIPVTGIMLRGVRADGG